MDKDIIIPISDDIIANNEISYPYLIDWIHQRLENEDIH